jgi:signal transduction histidine kinase
MVDAPASSPQPAAYTVARDPVLLLPVAAAVGLLTTWAALAGGSGHGRAAINLAVAWSYAVAAIVAATRPSLRRSGVLMMLAGASLLVADLQLAGRPLAWTTGWLLSSLAGAFVVHLVLSYPQGRIWSAWARITVVGAYLLAVAAPIATGLYLPEGRNLLLVESDRARAETISRVVGALSLVVAIAFVALIVARLIELRGAARRLVLPVLAGALLATPIFAVRSAAAADGRFSISSRLELADTASSMLIPAGFFAGMLWMRLRRSGASKLVVELREGGSETLRDRLAQALGDPTLEIGYWVSQSQGYVDLAGRPFDLPSRGRRAVTHVEAGGAPVAILVHDPALLDDRDLVESVRATAGLVLENERLAAEVRLQLAEVRASRARIVAAADDERRRLERDLHDGAQQRLVGLALKIGLARARTGSATAAADALAAAQDDLEQALAELREFARGVHPSVLREDGLDAAVEALARRASIPVEVVGELGERLPDTAELAAYFFVSEALANVAKHAHASRATVELRRFNGGLMVSVSDDGIGGADVRAGSGLAGLSDRLAALDGKVTVESAPHAGTTLTAMIPCAP